MPARSFDRGIEEMERTERQNISTQGVGAVPYGTSEPGFAFTGQSFPAYGQFGQQQWNPYVQSQPWTASAAPAAQQPWTGNAEQQFVPNVPFHYGYPLAQQFPPFFGQAIPPYFAMDPFITRHPQQPLYPQLGQQYGQGIHPYNVFAQPTFSPFGQTVPHPIAQQLYNPFLQHTLQQQPIGTGGHPSVNLFGQPVYAGFGQPQQQIPLNPISQQTPGIYGQQFPSSVPINPLFQFPPWQLTSPFAMQAAWSGIPQTPFAPNPQTVSGFGRFGQTPERAGMERQTTGQFGRGFQSQNMARAPKGYKRSDDRIKDDITERLMMYPEIDLSDVEILVKDGEVTLRGSIEDRNVKRIAEDISESIFGVRDVLNELRVAPRFQPGTKEREQELTGAVRGKEK